MVRVFASWRSGWVGVAVGVALFGTAFAQPAPVAAQSYRVVSKACDHCGGSVSLSAQVGDTCPHCGVTWGAEKQRVTGTETLPERMEEEPMVQPSRRRSRTATPHRRSFRRNTRPAAAGRWCMECGVRVAPDARPGQRCPRCGVRWTVFDPGYRPGSSRPVSRLRAIPYSRS